jgi:hypothetical protein
LKEESFSAAVTNEQFHVKKDNKWSIFILIEMIAIINGKIGRFGTSLQSVYEVIDPQK